MQTDLPAGGGNKRGLGLGVRRSFASLMNSEYSRVWEVTDSFRLTPSTLGPQAGQGNLLGKVYSNKDLGSSQPARVLFPSFWPTTLKEQEQPGP